MAIVRKEEARPQSIVIDLTGPDGNAYCVLGQMLNFAKQLGWSKDKIAQVRSEMTSSDYENLIMVFDREFGEFVTLLR